VELLELPIGLRMPSPRRDKEDSQFLEHVLEDAVRLSLLVMLAGNELRPPVAVELEGRNKVLGDGLVKHQQRRFCRRRVKHTVGHDSACAVIEVADKLLPSEFRCLDGVPVRVPHEVGERPLIALVLPRLLLAAIGLLEAFGLQDLADLAQGHAKSFVLENRMQLARAAPLFFPLVDNSRVELGIERLKEPPWFVVPQSFIAIAMVCLPDFPDGNSADLLGEGSSARAPARL